MIVLQQGGGNLNIGVDNPHLQLPPHPRAHLPDAVGHGPQALEHLPALLVEAVARLRELHPLVGAQEQAGAQLVLQHGQLPADGGLGHMELAGGAGDAASFGHGGKVFQLLEIHTIVLSTKKARRNLLKAPYFFYMAII